MELEHTPKAYKVRTNNDAQKRAMLCEQCLDFPRPVTEKSYSSNDRDEALKEGVRQILGTSVPSKAIEDMVKP